MSKVLALLSGKGGSGKTTLALSIATLLSNSGIRVLLVDCDLNTNGATYFFEDKLDAKNENLVSLSLLVSSKEQEGEYLRINENMDF